ncbi:hypothetical protein [Xanthomonas hortorum]|uniref:hypothetical protein n=1 Tax=Xanthomonas hortorum TaxID=56454 RepID=UPI0015936BAC|nr:hypothetical protein [Xanthomonas hortorum]NHF68433.1 hypothetical protein [Xanthomonas hortorum]
MSLGNAQQLWAAAAGYSTLAAYQSAQVKDREPQNLASVRHFIADIPKLTQRTLDLGLPLGVDYLINLFSAALADRAPAIVFHRDLSCLENNAKARVERLVADSSPVHRAIAEANHEGIVRVNVNFDLGLSSVLVGDSVQVKAYPEILLIQDPERPYAGTLVRAEALISIDRLGLGCFGDVTCEIEWAFLNDGRYGEDDGEPPPTTEAELYSGLLGIPEHELGNLVDVEPEELTGNTDEMTYGFRIDFRPHATPEMAARILQKNHTLIFEVDPSFYDGCRYDGWPH